MLAFMYLVPLVLLFIGKGRHYYMAPAYPMLLAMGAVLAERWLRIPAALGPITVETFYFTVFAFISAFVCALLLPLASSGPLKHYALSHSYDLREEIGWNQLVRTVAQIRDSLSPDQQAHLGITTGNYGEYGAIDVLGRAYALPEPIGTTNSEWFRGYPTPPPTTIIVLGNSRESRPTPFSLTAALPVTTATPRVRNEESQSPPRHLRLWSAAPALARTLERASGFRLRP